MVFSKFISIVFEILGTYYFIMLLFDVLQSNNKIAHVTTHTVQFERPENPIIISDESEERLSSANSHTEEDFKKYLPVEEPVNSNEAKIKSPIIDLGLETLSGNPYTVNAENLSKFMIA